MVYHLQKIEQLVNRINTRFGKGTIVYDSMNQKLNINSLDQNKFLSIFVRQYFQHHPEDAKKLDWKNKALIDSKNSNDLSKLEWFTLKDNTLGKYLSIRDSENSRYLLFEKQNGIYKKINTLGGFGFNEFSPFTYDKKSMVEENNINTYNSPTVEPIIVSTENSINNLDLTKGTVSIVENIITTNTPMSEIAKILLPYIDNSVGIESKDLKGLGEGVYVPDTGKN